MSEKLSNIPFQLYMRLIFMPFLAVFQTARQNSAWQPFVSPEDPMIQKQMAAWNIWSNVYFTSWEENQWICNICKDAIGSSDSVYIASIHESLLWANSLDLKDNHAVLEVGRISPGGLLTACKKMLYPDGLFMEPDETSFFRRKWEWTVCSSISISFQETE